MSLGQVETIVKIVASVATTIGLFVGALWSYLLFVQKRQRYPRASLEHQITSRHIGLDKVLVHVDVVVSNRGDVLVSLIRSETRVQQVLPLPEEVRDKIVSGAEPVDKGHTEVRWPYIGLHEVPWDKGECEIEPGDSQQINHDFILDADVRTIEVYSHVRNEIKRARELGWDLTTLYDIPPPQTPGRPSKQE